MAYLTLLALQIVAVPMLAVAVFLLLVLFAAWSLTTRPILVVIPIAIVIASMWWFARVHPDEDDETLEEELLGPGRRP